MNTNSPVCVTGASGFIASYIIRELLEKGYTVRGTVRGLKGGKAYQELTSLPGAAERLELVQADLLEEGAFDDVVAGCEYVIHTASPYVLDVKDTQRDLVDPALQGTRNVLGACARAGSVKKVVLTSSKAAMYDEPVPGQTLSEQDWNRRSTLDRNPYHYSKTVAEQAAWDFVEQQKPGFTLVVINPGTVIGPSLVPSLNTSHTILRDTLAGKTPAVINLEIGLVDVRDVAHAHVLAMENDNAQGRYLCLAEVRKFSEIVRLLKENGYEKYKLPKMSLESPFGIKLTRLLAYAQPKGVRQYLHAHVGKQKQFDTSRIRNELGMQFRPVDESILAAAEGIVKWGHV